MKNTQIERKKFEQVCIVLLYSVLYTYQIPRDTRANRLRFETAYIYLNKFSSCVRDYICNSCSLCVAIMWPGLSEREIERTNGERTN